MSHFQFKSRCLTAILSWLSRFKHGIWIPAWRFKSQSRPAEQYWLSLNFALNHSWPQVTPEHLLPGFQHAFQEALLMQNTRNKIPSNLSFMKYTLDICIYARLQFKGSKRRLAIFNAAWPYNHHKVGKYHYLCSASIIETRMNWTSEIPYNISFSLRTPQW